MRNDLIIDSHRHDFDFGVDDGTGDEITVDENGIVHGMDEKNNQQYLYFPPSEVVEALMHAVKVAFDAHVDETADTEEPLTNLSIVLSIPTPKSFLDSVAAVEQLYLDDRNRQERCSKCKREATNNGCIGVQKKGDLLRNLMSVFLVTGFVTTLEKAFQGTQQAIMEKEEPPINLYGFKGLDSGI